MSRISRLAVVGVGLIGGSLGMAWKKAQVADEVVGVVDHPTTIDEALEVGAVDWATTSLQEGVQGADVVVLCTPVSTILPLIAELRDHISAGTIVSDAGSTKGEICRGAWELLRGRGVFIGGHPMAGSERVGVLSGDPYLFENAVYVLTPPSSVYDGDLQVMQTLVTATGAHALILDPDEHDMIVAAVSHMPHVIAASLVSSVGELDRDHRHLLQLAAGGFRDTTRIAGGSPSVWRDICMSNREAIVDTIRAFEETLAHFKTALGEGDAGAMTALFTDARSIREGIPKKAKGIISVTHEMVVHVVDKPGAIAEVAGILADAQINIIDIEILRVREGEGGTLRVAVEGAQVLDRALEVLHDRGLRARKR